MMNIESWLVVKKGMDNGNITSICCITVNISISNAYPYAVIGEKINTIFRNTRKRLHGLSK